MEQQSTSWNKSNPPKKHYEQQHQIVTSDPEKLVGAFKHFLFSPLPEEMIQFD